MKVDLNGTLTGGGKNPQVDGMLMAEIRTTNLSNPVSDGISYQPQLVSRDFFHQRYCYIGLKGLFTIGFPLKAEN